MNYTTHTQQAISSSSVDEQALAQAELNHLLETQAQAVARVSASNFVALDTDKKLKTLSEYQFFIQNRTNCRK
ncbi:hypothetical protein NIES4072_67710 [Nostoc commune NIES-4072]|uniref:Uncharacterized protein n=1 Tax=Nostoc commune NIES-4072 TaxID=2005467 RepID=A0A2R5FYD6_NOSCO|nr:hypothetical protein [Nostoc commune]BBD70405.1 hypothetical protein NIES4070_68160 [Nostoc commune HK-02]GBG23059.1 hypothetical protein NIES4072_67710 [Nostoc commune NIES-4072]